ncbi:MAG: hypothetical protein IKC03_09715 [Oscillospiraceae bacterium]|nr:hypothetical protein [Oscillospiraceae bacterium]
MDGKTCRQIGAVNSFQEKVRNNEIWQIHQRAYKKYFARTKKNTMSNADFEQWASTAEVLRDETLTLYERAVTEADRASIAETFRKKVNCC